MEIWKPIKDFEGIYEVSDLGNIRSLDREQTILINYSNREPGYRHRKLKGQILKPYNNKDYVMVDLKDSKSKRYCKYVHRLVIETFTEELEGKPECNHINGIKHDNRLENLEWCNRSENILHAYATGLQEKLQGEDWHLARIKAKSRKLEA